MSKFVAYGSLAFMFAAAISGLVLVSCHNPWKVRAQGQTVVISKPWTRRMWPYMLALFLLAGPIPLAMSASQSEPGPLRDSNTNTFLLFWCLCAGIALGMCYLAAPETTTFDLAQRTFRFNRLWIGENSHFSGPMDEIRGTVVKAFSAKGGTHYYVRLDWRAPNYPDLTLGIFTNENAANAEADRIAQILHLN